MSEPAAIQITGHQKSLSRSEAQGLVGKIVHVPVGGTITAEGVSWFDLFRFAQVASVSSRSIRGRLRCPVCSTRFVRYEIEVKWEPGYESRDGNTLCEACIDGVVSTGEELTPFGECSMSAKRISISTTYDITK